MEKTTNPVWLITGCSTGFGRELAKLILARGWNAVITARNIDQVKDLAEGYANSALVGPLGIKVLVVEPGPFRTDWAGRSPVRTPVQIADYQESVGNRIKASQQSSGQQKGDPIRGCEAIIKAVEDGVPHLRLLLGKIA